MLEFLSIAIIWSCQVYFMFIHNKNENKKCVWILSLEKQAGFTANGSKMESN